MRPGVRPDRFSPQLRPPRAARQAQQGQQVRYRQAGQLHPVHPPFRCRRGHLPLRWYPGDQLGQQCPQLQQGLAFQLQPFGQAVQQGQRFL